ncbi:SUMF1/EgtB/PvdO family nonheme iron enzyme [Treponema zioleckii]|uniref:SUMF1/EgtB/PvdO family nonheme iron enzyme n=1 Tax=Treponema zioleckii TaxID=331680 RepID=UPI00168BE0A7|nr:SUMF1/EgtB/PvdO family nonheme iron enzyme [Treponema zioleckii]
MKCENCGFELADDAKFCPDCGQKVIRKMPFSLGEKNVIAGDVYGSKEDIHVRGNATFINKEDDTSKISPCAICGRHILLLSGYTCRKCGKFVCAECYSRKHKVCADCAEELEASESKEKAVMKNLESFIKAQAGNFDSAEDFSESAKNFLQQQLSTAFNSIKDKSKYSLDMVFVETEKEPSMYFASHPVTQKEFADVMDYNPSVFAENDSNPVENVSWYEALVFCNKLSARDNLKPCYLIGGTSDTEKWIKETGVIPEEENALWENVQLDKNANGYRLPTEAEWEYAACDGKNFEYAGTDFFDECAWCSSNSKNSTHEVCKKKPNTLGIYDLCGNVGEWCYEEGNDSSKPVRGGNFSNRPDDCKISSCVKEFSFDKSPATGFRVCASDLDYIAELSENVSAGVVKKSSEIRADSNNDSTVESEIEETEKAEETEIIPQNNIFKKLPSEEEKDFDTEVFSLENAKIVLENIENRMILVEGGKMELGSSDEYFENPVHTAEVKDFYISQIPVSQKIFKFIMGTEKLSNQQEEFGNNLPISCVSYLDAAAFCNVLSRLSGLEAVYSVGGKTEPSDWEGFEFPNEKINYNFSDDFKINVDENANGYRLPFADEYEYAVRNGIKAKDFSGSIREWLNNAISTNKGISELKDSDALHYTVTLNECNIDSRYPNTGFRIARKS